jgi:hypothetical protein
VGTTLNTFKNVARGAFAQAHTQDYALTLKRTSVCRMTNAQKMTSILKILASTTSSQVVIMTFDLQGAYKVLISVMKLTAYHVKQLSTFMKKYDKVMIMQLLADVRSACILGDESFTELVVKSFSELDSMKRSSNVSMLYRRGSMTKKT